MHRRKNVEQAHSIENPLCYRPLVVIIQVPVVTGNEELLARIEACQFKALGNQQNALSTTCASQYKLVSLCYLVDNVYLLAVQAIGLYGSVRCVQNTIRARYCTIPAQYVLTRNRNFGT